MFHILNHLIYRFRSSKISFLLFGQFEFTRSSLVLKKYEVLRNYLKKNLRHSASLGGIDRFTFQLDNAGLSHQQLSETIAQIGEEVIPQVRRG